MTKTNALLIIGSLTSIAYAGDSYVHGYTRRDGTYVQGYHRTAPDNTVNNNYSHEGNVNPYTGSEGHVSRQNHETSGRGNYGNAPESDRNTGYNSYGSDE